jgi:hypothetical protein
MSPPHNPAPAIRLASPIQLTSQNAIFLWRADPAPIVRDPELVALSTGYRFYNWDRWRRVLLRAYD